MSTEFKTDWKKGERAFTRVSLGSHPDIIPNGSCVDILDVDAEHMTCLIQGNRGIVINCGMDCLREPPNPNAEKDLMYRLDFMKTRMALDSEAAIEYNNYLKTLARTVEGVSADSTILMSLCIRPGREIEKEFHSNVDIDPSHLPSNLVDEFRKALLAILRYEQTSTEKKIHAIDNRYKNF